MKQTKINDFLQCENLFGASISVAVSGGSDSVALFFRLYTLQKEFSLSLSIVHVNYHLRGEESNGDAEFVRQLAARCDVPFYYRDVPLDAGQSGIEEQARTARYTFFAELKKSGRCEYIAVGHTREDQVETVLFRLVRGTSLHGISGMEAVRGDGIIRPLLEESREVCQQFLSEIGESWREDSSNATDDYSRNCIRHKILPVLQELNSSAFEHIVSFASHARGVQRATVQLGFEKLNQRGLYTAPYLFHFLREGEIDSFIVAAIASLLRDRGCSITGGHSEKIVVAGERAGKMELLPDGWRTYSSYKRLIFYHGDHDPFDCNSAGSWEPSLYRFPEEIAIDRVRIIEENDNMYQNGLILSARLKLKKLGVPARERGSLPVVENNEFVDFPLFM